MCEHEVGVFLGYVNRLPFIGVEVYVCTSCKCRFIIDPIGGTWTQKSPPSNKEGGSVVTST